MSDNDWIGVNDRLPDSGVDVLVVVKCAPLEGGHAWRIYDVGIILNGSWEVSGVDEPFERGSNLYQSYEYGRVYLITHWMPVPPMPEPT